MNPNGNTSYGQMPPPPPYAGGQSMSQHNRPYGQPVMGNVYASPPQMGSLGTPHMPRWNRSPSGSHDGRGSWKGGSHVGSNGSSAPGISAIPPLDPDVVLTLVPTRPLLKALAKECRPLPPWCVGFAPAQTLSEELFMFASFLRHTPEEQMRWTSLVATIDAAFREVWPNSVVAEMGTTAAGILMAKDTTAQFYALNTEDTPELRSKFLASANSFGFQVDFTTDYRLMSCVTLTEARTGERSFIRFGKDAAQCAIAAEVLKTSIAEVPARKYALVAIDALLRQNKVIDDIGSNLALLNGEAVALMLLSIANSYSKDDEPDAGRLLVDFFLTFGFPVHFDCAAHSVSYKGMDPPSPKTHLDAQLSVLDSIDGERNLTPKLEKFSHIQAVFHYCYTAISQFTQVSSSQRRAQSALSTVIGGESYWSRVLSMFHQGIAPFAQAVRDRQHILAQHM
eukprot:CAMPEP_0176474814 /NCGR_PEP_ID=MMETSP0127-20121128/43253_1 /TAXON_ID=938130 /ORGANISM="Platyophrya macrostoma, Strain WH" /LENGTH=451 /DNA_ID=CAMNT_0017870327 /DNA_START=78 /DNA_END=1433 /DNA_ORIENTATION=-